MDLQRLSSDEIGDYCGEDNTGSIFLLLLHQYFNGVQILCILNSIDIIADGSQRFNFGINGKQVKRFTGVKEANALICEFDTHKFFAVEIYKFDFTNFDKEITLRIYEFLY